MNSLSIKNDLDNFTLISVNLEYLEDADANNYGICNHSSRCCCALER